MKRLVPGKNIHSLQCVLVSLVAVSVIVSGTRGLAQQELPREVIAFPQLVLYNGKVLTADDNFTITEAIAIRDEKLLAVGTTESILKMAGPNTRKVDLKGKTVTPGFIDNHQHLPLYATQSIFMEREDIKWDAKFNPGGPWLHWESPEQILRNIAKVVAITPPGKWVVLYGESETRHVAWKLKRSQLDAVAPSHPVAVAMAAGGLNAVNSLALAKISKGLPGYPKGDEDVAIDGPAGELLLLDVLWNGATVEKTMDAMTKRMRDYGATSGYTTIGSRVYPTEMTALRELWVRGELTMRFRVGGLNMAPPPAGMPMEVAYQRQGNLSRVGDDWLKLGDGAGGSADSSIQSGGAWTWQPKLRVDLPGMEVTYGRFGPRGPEDPWPGHEGLVLATQYGHSPAQSSHSVGDRSTSAFLDAYADARKRGQIVKSSDQRHSIGHLTMVRPVDIPRFKELGVIPSIGPWFIFMAPNTDLAVHQYGKERVDTFMPVKSYITAGLKPTLEADVDYRPYRDPLWMIQTVVTRKDGQGRVWNAAERITRQQALWMLTNWAAYLGADEKKLGTLEAGKLADVIVLDGDYLTVPEDEISKIPVVMTIVGGRVVFETAGRF